MRLSVLPATDAFHSPICWDRILINGSQVTHPPIEPLREPMETRTFLGKKSGSIERGADSNLLPNEVVLYDCAQKLQWRRINFFVFF
jgi:hypothetical protein